MRRILAGVVCLLILPVPARAAESGGKVLREAWYESRTDQGKLGYMRFQAREIQRDGCSLIHTTIREEATFKRSGDLYSEKQEQYTLETPSGEIVELGYSINLSKQQQLTLRGCVQGDELILRAFNDGRPTQFGQRLPWDKATLGLYALDCYFQNKPLRDGDAFTVKEFSITANQVVPTTFAVKEISVGQGQRLTRIEQTYSKALYLPKMIFWVDDAGSIVRIEEDTPTFGLVRYERTSKETAMALFKPRVSDVESPIAVSRPISVKPQAPGELVVHVALEGEDDPGTLFVQDERQRVLKSDPEKVELRLLNPRRPSENGKRQPLRREYLDSNFFIRSDDALVQKLARQAVGRETDPRRQKRLIQLWLKARFRGSYEVAFATADEVARTMEGDCSEIGVLSAAMCRALGIPSRVVFGLIYDSEHPGFGGHLWTEVYLDGRWEPFDPTGILGQLNAAYIKIADYSLKDVLNPEALPEFRRAFAGRMKVEIIDSR